MKKIIFLARDLDSSRIIAKQLQDKNLIDGVIFETGKVAKKKKLYRLFRQRPWWRIMLLPLDIAFLLYLNWKGNRLFYQDFPEIPHIDIDLWIDDANEEKCLRYLHQQQPDILLIYGCAILREPILKSPKMCVINIHGGWVPKYRNVHGEFWAVAHRNYSELATSLLITGPGIDDGDIVDQKLLEITQPVSVSEAKQRIFKATLEITIDVVTKARNGDVPRRPQGKYNGPVFHTPSFLDWLRYRVKI